MNIFLRVLHAYSWKNGLSKEGEELGFSAYLLLATFLHRSMVKQQDSSLVREDFVKVTCFPAYDLFCERDPG